MEEEDSDRQEEKVEEKGRSRIKEMRDYEVRSELEPWNVTCETITTVEQMRSACRLSACTPRVR